MALVDVPVPPFDAALPARVSRFLEEAVRRTDAFVEARLDDPVVGFVPSDLHAVHAALHAIRHRHLAPGSSFCEWGSGLGAVAGLASLLGFDACGIEIVDELVEEARALAETFELPVEFVQGSFIPQGSEDLADVPDEFSWLEVGGEDAYDELGLDVEDFDVVFAYPWPGEEGVVEALFERHAAEGALLVTYRGIEDVRVQRVTRRR